jgi:hypothetical protein
MAATPGYKSRILAGSLNLSAQVRTASLNSATELIDVTVLSDGNKTFLIGPESGTFSASGPLDVLSSTNEPFDVYASWRSDSAPITFMIEGSDIGSSAWLIEGVQSSFDTTAQQGGTADYSISSESTGRVGFGLSAGHDTLTTTTTSANVDLGAAGTVGALVHLHVTSLTGIASDTVLVEHSADGSTSWTTLALFTAATGVTSQRIEFSGNTKRYVRVTDTIVGVGSTVRGVAVAKL